MLLCQPLNQSSPILLADIDQYYAQEYRAEMLNRILPTTSAIYSTYFTEF